MTDTTAGTLSMPGMMGEGKMPGAMMAGPTMAVSPATATEEMAEEMRGEIRVEMW